LKAAYENMVVGGYYARRAETCFDAMETKYEQGDEEKTFHSYIHIGEDVDADCKSIKTILIKSPVCVFQRHTHDLFIDCGNDLLPPLLVSGIVYGKQ
jgi:hypothetical protein